MLDHIKRYLRRRQIRRRIAAQCAQTRPSFEALLPLPWLPRSVLVSEALSFCAMCDLFDVDMVLESGVYEGRSTEVWARYGGPSRLVIAVDREIRPDARARLEPYPHLHLVEGDSNCKLSEIVAMNRDRCIGVFIDGPKGPAAIRLGRSLLETPCVKFVGLHDVHWMSFGKTNLTRVELERYAPEFCTDESWFVGRYKYLDISESKRDEEQSMRWIPYELKTDPGMPERKLGSYGPTIGYMVSPEASL